MRITVRCFASVRELLGQDRLAIELPDGATVRDLKAQLCMRAPDLERLPVTCAVNRAYADPSRALRDGDEVAFIPPISGGSGSGSGEETAGERAELFRFDLVHAALDPRPLEREVRTDGDGAVVTFAGTTRDQHDGRAVLGLAYEAYAEMAGKLMVALFEQALQRFAITRARVAHRLGEVPVGETSVLVVVSAPHRAAAFDACRFLMDRIKAEIPIFKKERFAGARDADGARWVGDLPEGQPRA